MSAIAYADLTDARKAKIQFAFRRVREAVTKIAAAIQDAQAAFAVVGVAVPATSQVVDTTPAPTEEEPNPTPSSETRTLDGAEAIPNTAQGGVSAAAGMTTWNELVNVYNQLGLFVAENTATARKNQWIAAVGPEPLV